MLRTHRAGRTALAAVAAMALAMSGCTSLRDYVHNGYKVGPNYCPPSAPSAERWIDADDKHVRQESEDLSQWWTVFNDPTLNRLIATAYRQNLTLREAGFRILQARAQLGIAEGNLFPQQQGASGTYRREGVSQTSSSSLFSPKRFFDQWSFGFNLAWELDFWGRFRRAVAAADRQLDASVEDYDYVLVTLLSDVAANYVQIRTDEQRIALLQKNAELQNKVLAVAQDKLDKGIVDELDRDQAASNLRQTEAAVHQLEIDLRQANNRLCILLGIPPVDLQDKSKAGDLCIGTGDIPTTPPEVAVGIPAELLRRRPDVRRAERLAAAQAEQIGIAEADLYPAFSIDGTLGYQAGDFSALFSSKAFNGSVGPSFQWNLLNYGRIANNIRLQDARFRELVVAYQDTVLQANAEVENGLVSFLQAQIRERLLDDSVKFAERAVKTLSKQYDAGKKDIDFNRYAVIEQNKIQQDDLWAQARGQIAQGLIQVYRALGGGWQIRCQPEEAAPAAGPATAAPDASKTPEEIPAPAPQAAEVPKEPPAAAKPAPDPPRSKAATPTDAKP